MADRIRLVAKRVLSKLLQNGVSVRKTTEANILINYLARLYPVLTDIAVVHVGPDGDGGYWIPDPTECASFLFSPGCANAFEFEMDLFNAYKIASAVCDPAHVRPESMPEYISFDQIAIAGKFSPGFTTLQSWVDSKSMAGRSDLILQMDIEGDEYNVLTYSSTEILSAFSIVLIEFHGIDLWLEPDRFKFLIQPGIEALLGEFLPVTMCINPNGQTFKIQNYLFPKMVEIGFIRKDIVRIDQGPTPTSIVCRWDRSAKFSQLIADWHELSKVRNAEYAEPRRSH